LGFALLSRHFEESAIPDEMPALLPGGWVVGLLSAALMVLLFGAPAIGIPPSPDQSKAPTLSGVLNAAMAIVASKIERIVGSLVKSKRFCWWTNF
jgi:hypothetical protein